MFGSQTSKWFIKRPRPDKNSGVHSSLQSQLFPIDLVKLSDLCVFLGGTLPWPETGWQAAFADQGQNPIWVSGHSLGGAVAHLLIAGLTGLGLSAETRERERELLGVSTPSIGVLALNWGWTDILRHKNESWEQEREKRLVRVCQFHRPSQNGLPKVTGLCGEWAKCFYL